MRKRGNDDKTMNEVVLIGRLTKDPELRYTQNNTAVCTFTLAVDRDHRKDDQNSNQPDADFIRITVWGKQGENCASYITKGRQVAVSGRIQTGSYQDRDGRTVYTTDVVALRVEFLGRKDDQTRPSGGNQQTAPQRSGGYQNASRQSATPAAQQRREPRTQPPVDPDIPEGFQEVIEDDLPF